MFQKRRRTIEIYFILYLAALILLLPAKKNLEDLLRNNSSPIVKSPFTIQPMKPTLNCRLLMDTSGPKILSLDSINTILYTGDVEDVKFEFIVKDQSLRQQLPLSSAQAYSTKYFRFEERPSQQAAYFFWNPPLNERINKSYIIQVIATAKPRNGHEGNNNSTETRTSKQLLKAETQFSLNMFYLNTGTTFPYVTQGENVNLLASDTSLTFRQPSQIITQLTQGEISLQPDQPHVSAIAYQKWSNQIWFFNGNPKKDLLKMPDVKTVLDNSDNGGTAKILAINDNNIILTGKTPSYGKMKVTLISIFKNNRKEISTDFIVSPLPIHLPDYEKYMYPDKIYTIDPKLPLLYDQETKAFIKDGNKMRFKSEQGEKFQFSPDISDTGKYLTLERWVDNNLYDQYSIRILNYPDPEIYDIQTVSSSEVKVITRSYGFYKGSKNFAELEIDGNANSRELYGTIPEQPDKITHVQVFKCTQKNPDKPFIFKLRSVDTRGRKSQYKNYE